MKELLIAALEGTDRPTALQRAWSEFCDALKEVGPGAIAFSAWEDWTDFEGEDFSMPESMARWAILATVLPDFRDRLQSQHDDYGGDDSWELDFLTALGQLGVTQNAVYAHRGYLQWTINGAGMGWAGDIEVWAIDDRWRMLTACDDREVQGDYLPRLLGFTDGDIGADGLRAVIHATTGGYLSRPDSIMWRDMPARDALYIAAGFGDSEPPLLEAVDSEEFDDWCNLIGTEDNLRLADLAVEVGKMHRSLDLTKELTRRLVETMARRRELQPIAELPFAKTVDSLSDEDVSSLRQWFAQHRRERLHNIQWLPNGLAYRFSGPSVWVTVARQRNYRISFPDADAAPTLGEALARLREPEPGTAAFEQFTGETDLGFADFLIAHECFDDAEQYYEKALQHGGVREKLAAAGHYILRSDLQRVEPVVLAVIERCDAMRQAAAAKISSAEREASFRAALSLERDAQRVLVVAYANSGERVRALAALERWRLLVHEYGEGPDPFAVP